MAETPMQGLADWLRADALDANPRNAAKLNRWASEVEAARASLPAPTDLHAAIMNLLQRPPKSAPPDWAWHDGYKIGHRDARHDAAELVAAQQALEKP